jgi:radical SAM superfamily enzyme YgiQ (UPF0313 family)
MTLLLVNPPGLRPGRRGSFFADQQRNLRPEQYASMPMEHLGMMSIASYARSRGVPVRTVNGLVSSHKSVDETWAAMRLVESESGRPTVVGFSIIDTIDEVIRLTGYVRRTWPEVPIVLGNVMASLNYDRILTTYDCFDFVAVGEGEVVMTELCEQLASGGRGDGVPGLAHLDEYGKVVLVPPRLQVLDELPPPARDELPLVLQAGFAGAVYSTRGCPYRCTFCGTGAMSEMLGKDSYRYRSVEKVADEIAYLVHDFGIGFVSITDDLFMSKHPAMQARALAFADELLRRRLDVHFMIDARLDSVEDFSIYDRLYEAGLRRVFIGIETGSREQLVAYRKRSLRQGEDAEPKLRKLQDRGIEVIPGTIMFHPTVRPAELRETARLLRSLDYRTPRKFLDQITAYPGTPLHAEYAAKGLLVEDWPIGRWTFADPRASQVHAAINSRIDGDPQITYDSAEQFFLEQVESWEAELRGVDHADRTEGVAQPCSSHS